MTKNMTKIYIINNDERKLDYRIHEKTKLNYELQHTQQINPHLQINTL